MSLPVPPQSVEELMCRAENIAGKTLGELSQEFATLMPDNLLTEKGWVGQFIEKVLGASAGSLPEPDFQNLGIELKTIPVDDKGKPLESTYVSVVPLMNHENETWKNSLVRKKLTHVLWIPVLSPKGSEIASRILGMPLLWRPTPEQESILQSDWEETMEKVILGNLGELNSRFGQALQVRPKAANSKILTDAIGNEGQLIKTLPRGFYLRTSFTHSILRSLSY